MKGTNRAVQSVDYYPYLRIAYSGRMSYLLKRAALLGG